MSDDRPEVLYVCVHNAGRSQMAALFTERLGRERVVVRSAGSAPADRVNPMVVEVMAELADPADAADLDAVRAIREEIRGRVERLLGELGVF